MTFFWIFKNILVKTPPPKSGDSRAPLGLRRPRAAARPIRFFGSLKLSWVRHPPKKAATPELHSASGGLALPHVPSAQQQYDMPANERPSVPHIGEGGAWKSPARGRLACPPPLSFRRCLLLFFFRTSTFE